MTGVTEATEWWCSRCGRRARLEGPADLPRTLRKAVHDFTNQEKGPDGHLMVPVDEEPPLWAAVRRLKAEAGDDVDLTARYGVLGRLPRAGRAPSNHRRDEDDAGQARRAR